MYVNVPTPPAAAALKTYAVPAVAPGTGDGALKAISGLITRVGVDVSTAVPTRLVAVATTLCTYLHR